MENQNPVTQVPNTNPTSVEQQLHSAWVKNQITDHEYFDNNAVLIAAKANLYQPLHYPTMSDAIHKYLYDRKTSSLPYNETLSKKTAEWVSESNNNKQENDSNLKTLLWARGRCLAQGLTQEVAILDRAIERLTKLRFPIQFRNAVIVVQKDSNESEGKKK